ncbi:MAG: microviridin/marinostatin family tricyclic proteinase inhibitor [Acidobacteria bacterium]|nr:microviridin/marinostatin family tricyclic proteinase inhibitor [Acidobacteriota bacterium]
MQDNTDASNHHDSLQQEGSLPFFARFLEGQNNAERSAATTKYPSDLDEFTTLKYPSDGDDDTPTEDSILAAATERRISALTLKYPSDFDEGDMTMKYPSDDDESNPDDRVYRT